MRVSVSARASGSAVPLRGKCAPSSRTARGLWAEIAQLLQDTRVHQYVAAGHVGRPRFSLSFRGQRGLLIALQEARVPLLTVVVVNDGQTGQAHTELNRQNVNIGWKCVRCSTSSLRERRSVPASFVMIAIMKMEKMSVCKCRHLGSFTCLIDQKKIKQ